MKTIPPSLLIDLINSIAEISAAADTLEYAQFSIILKPLASLLAQRETLMHYCVSPVQVEAPVFLEIAA